MEVDTDSKDSKDGHIAELENIEDDVDELLRNVHHTMILLSKLDPEKEDEIKESIQRYHQLLQSIEASLTKQINQCREPLLLPLLPIGHQNQYISNDARDIHKKLFSQKQNKQNKQKRNIIKSQQKRPNLTHPNHPKQKITNS